MSVAIRTEFLQIPEDLMTLPSASAKKKKKHSTNFYNGQARVKIDWALMWLGCISCELG